MDQQDSSLTAFLSNPYTELFLYLLSESSANSLSLVTDITTSLPTDRANKLIGHSQGTLHLESLISQEKDKLKTKLEKHGPK